MGAEENGERARFAALVQQARPSHGRSGDLDFDATMANLGIDSLAIVNLIVQIEDEFEIVFPRGLLLPRVFTSPTTLWSALSEFLAAQTSV
jgi:acyl carrier protein